MLHNSIFNVLKSNLKHNWSTKFYTFNVHVHAATKRWRNVVRIWVCQKRNIPVKYIGKCVIHNRSPQYMQVVLGGEPQRPETLKSLLPFHIVLAIGGKSNGVILRSWTWLYSRNSAIDKGGAGTFRGNRTDFVQSKHSLNCFMYVNSLETFSEYWELHRVVQFVWIRAYPYSGALLINYTVLLKTPINI